MATVDLGKIRFNWTGAYNNSTAYVANDVVSSGGNSYICILASTGNAVSNGTYWSLMSQAGTNGTDVGTTITTQGDVLYRDGSGLQRLAKGTAAQQLAMNSGATAPEWITPAASGLSSFRATGSDSHSLTSGAWTLMQMGTEVHDAESQYDNSASNFKWTPSAGKVLIGAQVATNGGPGDTKYITVVIYKNGVNSQQQTVFWVSGTEAGFEGYSTVGFFEANGTDYFQVYAKHNKGSTFNTYAGYNTFWGVQIS